MSASIPKTHVLKMGSARMPSSEALRRCLGDCEVSPGQAVSVWERQCAETPPGHPKSPASGCSSLSKETRAGCCCQEVFSKQCLKSSSFWVLRPWAEALQLPQEPHRAPGDCGPRVWHGQRLLQGPALLRSARPMGLPPTHEARGNGPCPVIKLFCSCSPC